MIIHVIKEGDTLHSIAESYGISEERIILENAIINPRRLAIGQTLVLLKPETSYIIKEGDTLAKIAESFDVTVLQLLRNNAYLSDREFIYPGETIVISYEDKKDQNISVNGYIYPFIDRNTLRKTLPYLTYMTIFSYQVTSKGEILEIEDDELIDLARAYGVAPIMMIIGDWTSQEEEINVAHIGLANPDFQDRFIEKIMSILENKGYYGVNVNIPYLHPKDRANYIKFTEKFTKRLSRKGYKIFNTLSLHAFEILTGVIYTGLEYEKLGETVDYAVSISYDWGYTSGFPSAIISNDIYRRFLSFITQKIPPEKLLAGMSCIGHLWKLPYIPGESKGMLISYNTAIDIAYDNGAAIRYDSNTEAAYYQYIDNDEYIVRFRDARTTQAYLGIVKQFDIYGGSIWNIMMFFAPMWLVINSQCEIVKVL